MYSNGCDAIYTGPGESYRLKHGKIFCQVFCNTHVFFEIEILGIISLVCQLQDTEPAENEFITYYTNINESLHINFEKPLKFPFVPYKRKLPFVHRKNVVLYRTKNIDNFNP